MATAVASRFAVLSLDVEDDAGRSLKKRAAPAAGDAPSGSPVPKDKGKATSGSQPKQQDAKKKNNKKKGDSNNAQPSAKKGENGQQQKSAKKTDKPKNHKDQKQWEEWKKKDQEFVSESYEQDLHEAMMQSKLEYDEACKVKKALGLYSGPDEEAKKKNKSQKPQPMSLGEFNSMTKEQPKKQQPKEDPVEEDTDFFEKINEITARALDQELNKEKFKSRVVLPENEVHVTLAQLQDVLEKRNKEIAELKNSLANMEFELVNVKARNSRLCAMLAQGEMKDKVNVLLEVEKLKTSREELLSEVQTLHAQLEQERSKVHDLTKASDKQKSKKAEKKK